MAVVVKSSGIPFWLVGEFSSPPIEPILMGGWDVHWGYGSLTHGQMALVVLLVSLNIPPKTGGIKENASPA